MIGQLFHVTNKKAPILTQTSRDRISGLKIFEKVHTGLIGWVKENFDNILKPRTWFFVNKSKIESCKAFISNSVKEDRYANLKLL